MSRSDALPPLLPDEVDFYGFYHSTKDMLIPLKPRLCIKFAEFYRDTTGTAKYKLQLFGSKCKINLKRRTVDLESDEAIAVDGKIQFALIRLRENELYYVNGYLGRGESLPADTGDQRLLGEDYVIHTPCFIVAVHKDFISQCTDMFCQTYDKVCGTQTFSTMESEATFRSASLLRLREATKKCRIPVRFRVIRLPDKNFKAVNIERDTIRKTEGFDELPKPRSVDDKIESDSLMSVAITSGDDLSINKETPTDFGNNQTAAGMSSVDARPVCDADLTHIHAVEKYDAIVGLAGSRATSFGFDDASLDSGVPSSHAKESVKPIITTGKDIQNKYELAVKKHGYVVFVSKEKNVFCVYNEKEREFYKVDRTTFPLELRNRNGERMERCLKMNDEVDFIATPDKVINGEITVIEQPETTDKTESEEKKEVIILSKVTDDKDKTSDKTEEEEKKDEAACVTEDGYIITGGSDIPKINLTENGVGDQMTTEQMKEIKETLKKVDQMSKAELIRQVVVIQLSIKRTLEYVANLCSKILPQISQDTSQTLVKLDQLRQPSTSKSLFPKKRISSSVREQFEKKHDPVTGLYEMEESQLYSSTLIEMARVAAWKVHNIETFHIKDGRNEIYESVLMIEYRPFVEMDSEDRKFCDVCVDELDKANPVAYSDRIDDTSISAFDSKWYVMTDAGNRLTLGRGRSSNQQRAIDLAAKNILPKMVAHSQITLINEILEKKQQILRQKQERDKFAEGEFLHSHLSAPDRMFGEPAPAPAFSESAILTPDPKESGLDSESSTQHPKSFVFDFCQANKLPTPKKTEYISGYDDYRPCWTAIVNWNGDEFNGAGSTKKQAEFKAYQTMRFMVHQRLSGSAI